MSRTVGPDPDVTPQNERSPRQRGGLSEAAQHATVAAAERGLQRIPCGGRAPSSPVPILDAMAIVAPDREQLYRCKRCEREFPWELMVKNNKTANGIIGICLACRRAQRTAAQRARRGLVSSTAREQLYRCKHCGGHFPWELMVKNRKSPSGVLRTCLPCHRAQGAAYYRARRDAGDQSSSSSVREQLARMREAYGHKLIDTAPDPQPARLLAELLRADRDIYRMSFEEAFPEGVEFVLERVDGKDLLRERDEWREALVSQRAAWEAAWERRPGPGSGLNVALLDGLAQVA